MSEVNSFLSLTSDFELAIQDFIASLRDSKRQGVVQLCDSISYSLTNGGKRFRPQLIIATASALDLVHNNSTKGQRLENPVLAWALSIECVHTYSLIHDDLPCIDNDDFRRGQPTNHKVYGEDLALLAGDALLTKAFELLAFAKLKPEIAIALVHLLSQRAGLSGMVGGQAIDLRNEKVMDLPMLEELHRLKTGALISASMEGVGRIAESTESQITELRELGFEIGLCFQLKDDLLDGNQMSEASKNFVFQLGLARTEELLASKSANIRRQLGRVLNKSEELIRLVDFNLDRKL